MTPYDQAFAQLNPQQRQAVETLEGPVMVLAGPGTGKTQVLAMRIAHILRETDTQPHNILALTFTEAAAKNMRQRLLQLIGPAAYAVHVHTFHAFCDEVIRGNSENFPEHHESQVLSDLERYELWEDLLRTTPLTTLKTINSPFHYLKAILKAISDLKREHVEPGYFAKLVADEAEACAAAQTAGEMSKTALATWQRNVEKQSELAQLYALYQKTLRERQRYDYDDMIALVAAAFAENEELLQKYQEKLTYFLVDEYQDTNAAQNHVVDALAAFWGEQANVFVVGDPHQSIYRFQGASLENTLNFVHRYPTAKVITLTTGYRCPQVIYDAAAEVIRHNPEMVPMIGGANSESAAAKQATELVNEVHAGLRQALKSTHAAGEPIAVYAAPTAPLETIYVVEHIQKLLRAGTPAREIAILYRQNSDAADFAQALHQAQIPYVVDVGEDALRSDELAQFFTLCETIRAIHTGTESRELYQVLNFAWVNLPVGVVMRLTRTAANSKMSLYERIREGQKSFAQLQFGKDVTPLEFGLLEHFAEQLVRWGKQDAQLPFPDWLQLVWQESGFLGWILQQPQKLTLLYQLQAVLREATNWATGRPNFHLDDFLATITTLRRHNISIAVEELPAHDQAVTLATAHKAKGREWSEVFLVRCVDGKWGNSRQKDALPLPAHILQYQTVDGADPNADDRRLFYVALTRAKKHCIITFPENLANGNQTKVALGSVFLAEISASHQKAVQAPASENTAAEHLATLLTLTPVPHPSLAAREKAWLQQLAANLPISVSALNQYLRSPQEFFEKHLLKVPQPKPAHFAYGTAIHAALEHAYGSALRTGMRPTLDKIQTAFETSLRTAILAPAELEERLAQGKNTLAKYFAEHEGEVVDTQSVEQYFGGGWKPILLDDIALNGRIDRIDWLDREHHLLRVIDYKTGHSHTQNEILGKVGTQDFSARELALSANIRGPLYRQLLFYKLLTQLDPTFPGTVAEGVFEFVEPERNGKLVRRKIPLPDEDVEELKKLIREVAKEIRELAWWEK